MTRIGAKQETEIISAFVCVAASQNVHGRFWDAFCILAAFHASNALFGVLKRHLNAAFQFPFLAVSVLTFSKAVYIISDLYELRIQLMSSELLSISVFLLHFGSKTFFTERSDARKGFPPVRESPGLIFLMLVLFSIVIEIFTESQRASLFIVQLILSAFLIGGLNRLFHLAERIKK